MQVIVAYSNGHYIPQDPNYLRGWLAEAKALNITPLLFEYMQAFLELHAVYLGKDLHNYRRIAARLGHKTQ